ncbi:glycosyl transferase [Pavlovales sp. CCMP2436]|nr:glycosyl transferase [Pavlovales sp. CCMP2436]
MLERDALGYASARTVLFQRLSVMHCDLLLYAGVAAALGEQRPSAGPVKRGGALAELLVFALVVCDAGLLLVDHCHFQYNGFLLGLLLLAVAAVERGAHVRAAVLFSVLIHLKHLYLLAAPLFLVHLLRAACYTDGGEGPRGAFMPGRFCALGAVVVGVSAISLGPFAAVGALPDIAVRLFPFGERGLTHTYWAPNVWALYNFCDCAAVVGARALRAAGLVADGGWLASAAAAGLAHSSGTVEPEPHALLPSVNPAFTLLLTLALNAPVLAAVWARPSRRPFGDALCLVSLAAFLAGWHVHEKAILAPLLLAALRALDGPRQLRAFAMLAAPAHYALLPLLHEPAEYPLRLLAPCTYAAGAALAVAATDARLLRAFTRLDLAYLAGFAPLELAASWLLPALAARLPFLPLMLTSVYCAFGVVRASWLHARLFFAGE